MGAERFIKMNIKVLEQIQSQLRLVKTARVRIGILGEKANRVHPEDPSGKTMSEIGLLHEFGGPAEIYRRSASPVFGEFGSIVVPARSFLRMPIGQNTRTIVGRVANQFAKAVWDNKLLGWFKKLGIEARNQVDWAFESAGFGTWKANSPVTVALKGSAMPLIDTGMLRRSISSDVVVNDVPKHD